MLHSFFLIEGKVRMTDFGIMKLRDCTSILDLMSNKWES